MKVSKILKYIIIINLIQAATINFYIDMNNAEYPNNDYDNVIINGSWNNWNGWGLTLDDDDNDGIYFGSIELDLGVYEYVVAVSGPADNWSGWGQVINAPLGSLCDWNPDDQWANYGFAIHNQIVEENYCAGTCNETCLADDSEFVLIKPENYAALRTNQVFFEWEQIPNAISYQLQVSNEFANSSFESVVLDTLIEDLVYIDKNNFDWDESFWWKIRPKYENDVYGSWSNINSFVIRYKKFPEINASIIDDDLIQDGLVFFGGFAGATTDLASGVIDKYGNEIWNDGSLNLILNHINESGNIYGFSGNDFPNNSGVKVNYNNDIIWSAPNGVNVDMHEIKQIPNGNYMAFVHEYTTGPIPLGPWTPAYQAVGYQADGVTNEYSWFGQKIVEWDSDGNEIWSWNPFDHFTMEDHDLYADLWWDFNSGAHDWMHSNAFHFDDNESVIYVSHRHLSRISKISYPSGDVIWNIGMPPEYNTGDDNICTEIGNSFQHNVQLLDDGTLLFFDNGNLSQMLLGDSFPTTRIRRIKVHENSYCESIWEYELPPNLFGAGMGSVQLLENGNYLIYTFGNGQNQGEPTLREITPDHDVVWNYQGVQNAAWYRAYKIPSMFPDAFSVIADDFIQVEYEGHLLPSINYNNSLKFFIKNHSGYANDYIFSFNDISSESNVFNNIDDSILIEPYSTAILEFPVLNSSINVADVQLLIYPKNFYESKKELIFKAIMTNVVLGDINNDGAVNIIDVVMLVDQVLNENYNSFSDLNNDNVVNVIDIVQLVSMILN